MRLLHFVYSLAALCFSTAVMADESLKGIACRSVHLGYPAEEGISFYNEVAIRESAAGTYFMVCGWGKGYFGVQELADHKKVILFSVWDPGDQNDPNTVNDEQRVMLLHKDEAVRVGRFGNEGTGGQSFFDYDWQIDTTYRFLVTARADGQRSEYAGYFYVPEEQQWKHLVTFSTPTGGELLRGHYSFIEDFRRNRISTTHTRRADFGPGWVQSKNKEWTQLKKADFTGDANPVVNIDAGLRDGRMFLATGGEIKNHTIPLGKSIEIQQDSPQPTDLPSVSKPEK